MRILMIEDDEKLCEAVAIHLEAEGYEADFCHDGEEGLYCALQNGYDLILLDRMLPELDGISLLARLRREGFHTPVLMLTALGSVCDRVDGLDAGADDYLAKPFAVEELLARVRAMLRRAPRMEERGECAWGDVRLDTVQSILTGPAGACPLTKKEAGLLELFLKKPGQTLPRNMLFVHVWGAASEVDESNLDGYVHFVRRRLGRVGSALRIVTARGVGYRLEAAE